MPYARPSSSSQSIIHGNFTRQQLYRLERHSDSGLPPGGERSSNSSTADILSPVILGGSVKLLLYYSILTAFIVSASCNPEPNFRFHLLIGRSPPVSEHILYFGLKVSFHRFPLWTSICLPIPQRSTGEPTYQLRTCIPHRRTTMIC